MKRLTKTGFITTLIGLGILIFSGMMIWTSRTTPTEMSGWIFLGMTFLRANDSILGLEKKD